MTMNVTSVMDRPTIDSTHPIQLKTCSAFDGLAHDSEKNTVNIVRCSHVHVTDVALDCCRSVVQPSVCQSMLLVFRYMQVPSVVI